MIYGRTYYEKDKEKSLSALLFTVSASLLVSVGVQTFIRPTKIIFAEETKADVRVEKGVFTGEKLKVKEEVIYSGPTQTKKVFKYRTDGSLNIKIHTFNVRIMNIILLKQ